MKPVTSYCLAALLLFPVSNLLGQSAPGADSIPLPEHPRPDFERVQWENLNGSWEFKFDADNVGQDNQWFAAGQKFEGKILVPFPWGAPLSGVENKADIGWYARSVSVPEDWKGQRVFLVVGASDWTTSGWLDGKPLGTHQGGYTPFEFEVTDQIQWGNSQRLVLRVDDSPHPFKLEGKQGYGPARGIWQTLYLEARPQWHIDTIHYVPDIDKEQITVKAAFSGPAPDGAKLALRFRTGNLDKVSLDVPKGADTHEAVVKIASPRLWSLDDPFLYEVDALASAGAGRQDSVCTYFGMRDIRVIPLPGTDYPYIALNKKPVYLQIALDQAYHPEGFYTWPSDDFMREEIVRSRQIGLNAIRIHVKIDLPRKLYWADRLGLLVMADVPNSWGEPDADMRSEIEYALRQMIRRDFNHPSIFSWVPFNETWGLFTNRNGERTYLPETQEWVASVYRLAKALDPTRLVEDNSPCNFDHVETDINSWHSYLPGYAWKETLDQYCDDTYSGSGWNFVEGRKQSGQPLLNSECGNVWGYEGSTGDVDWSWDYHIMMNEFRRHPKICGWLYTEHHDVINEWNGYWRYDRSDKYTGLEDLVPGMSLRDWHGPFYLSTGSDLIRDVQPGDTVSVPLFASFLTDRSPSERLTVRSTLNFWDQLGNRKVFSWQLFKVDFEPWMAREISPSNVRMPGEPGLALLALTLESDQGQVLHRNFTTFRIGMDKPLPRSETHVRGPRRAQLVRLAPSSYTDAQWSDKTWNVLDGLKVNGAGHGHFEYRVEWPNNVKLDEVGGLQLVMEASAKQLFGKDREGMDRQEGDFMRGRGTHDPSLNKNAYPMTDTVTYPSLVRVVVNGIPAGSFDLPDDPADHRGILSWGSQLRDRVLREAGSYGYLISATVPSEAIAKAAADQQLLIRLEVDPSLPGGLAIYGEQFGRYPLDPTLVFNLKAERR